MEQKRCYGCMRLKQDGPVCEHCGFDERMENSPHQLPAGTVLQGQYLVGKVLGQGGFGITYMGWDTYLNLPVAIKEYYPVGVVMRDCTHSTQVVSCEGSDSDRFEQNRKRFLREAQALARLGDVPEVVHVMGFFPENGTAYIIMEYIAGRTLKTQVEKEGPLPAWQLNALFMPILKGLQKVHEAGLVHRDISPDNIMILPDGRMKLLDFGAVRDFENNASLSTEAILKHGYAPMEQYQRRGGVGPWTDIYALCCTMYYCLTGQIPPDAPERMMFGQDITWDSIPNLTEAQLCALTKGTAMMVKDRFQSITGLRDALTGVVPVDAHKPEPKKEVPAKEPVPERMDKRPRRMPIALLITLLAVLIGAFVLLRNGPDKDIPVATTTAQTTQETLPPTTAPTETVPEETLATFQIIEDEKATHWAGENVTVSLENGRTLTVTMKNITLPETFPVDLSTDPIDTIYAWQVTINDGIHSIMLSTSYSIQFRSNWKGELTLDEMQTRALISKSTGGIYMKEPVKLTYDETSITWQVDITRLNTYRMYQDNDPFDFDFDNLQYINAQFHDKETDINYYKEYYATG